MQFFFLQAGVYSIIHIFCMILGIFHYCVLKCCLFAWSQNLLYFFSISPSPRPRASSSSSQPERGTSPLILNSTQSLEAMPHFAFPEDEGNRFYAHFNLIFGKIKGRFVNWSVCKCSFSICVFLEGLVSNLRRIRLRSNSTGTRPTNRRDHKGPRCFGLQQETSEKLRSPFTCKVPKSASVSGLSLIVTAGKVGSDVFM